MSYEAVSWAMAQNVGKSSTKFVLVAMAEHVNGKDTDMLCFPSVQALSSVQRCITNRFCRRLAARPGLKVWPTRQYRPRRIPNRLGRFEPT